MSFKIVIEKLLMISGILGLVSLGDDIIRWSKIIHEVIEYYRAIITPVFNFIGNLIGISIPRIYQDLIVFLFSILSGANIHVYRTRKSFLLWETVKMFYMEAIRKGYYKKTEQEIKLFRFAIAIAYFIVFLLVLYLAIIHPHIFGKVLILAFFIKLLEVSFSILCSFLGFKYSQKFDITRLPEFFITYTAYFFICIFVFILASWRFQIYIISIFVGFLLLNELYLRIYSTSNCVVYSIPETCKFLNW